MLPDIDPATFNIMLRFMYTDALPAEDELGDYNVEMMQHLFAAADRQVEANLCSQFIRKFTGDVVVSVLSCAYC